jgi:hypothetical protein
MSIVGYEYSASMLYEYEYSASMLYEYESLWSLPVGIEISKVLGIRRRMALSC